MQYRVLSVVRFQGTPPLRLSARFQGPPPRSFSTNGFSRTFAPLLFGYFGIEVPPPSVIFLAPKKRAKEKNRPHFLAPLRTALRRGNKIIRSTVLRNK